MPCSIARSTAMRKPQCRARRRWTSPNATKHTQSRWSCLRAKDDVEAAIEARRVRIEAKSEKTEER